MSLPNEPASILIVEDRRELREVLRRSLGESGFRVSTATDGEEGLAAALDERPDLMILDVGLPVRSGVEVTRELREREFDAPILMLTAHAEVADRLRGFDAGADDYLAKPFNYDELLARVRALLRRTRGGVTGLRVGDLACDPMAHRISRGGTPLPLTQREFAILELFMRNPGRVLSRDEISRAIWQVPCDPENNIIDVYISYLRGKLDVAGDEPLLHTVRGVGYVLEARKGKRRPARRATRKR